MTCLNPYQVSPVLLSLPEMSQRPLYNVSPYFKLNKLKNIVWYQYLQYIFRRNTSIKFTNGVALFFVHSMKTCIFFKEAIKQVDFLFCHPFSLSMCTWLYWACANPLLKHMGEHNISMFLIALQLSNIWRIPLSG